MVGKKRSQVEFHVCDYSSLEFQRVEPNDRKRMKIEMNKDIDECDELD